MCGSGDGAINPDSQSARNTRVAEWEAREETGTDYSLFQYISKDRLAPIRCPAKQSIRGSSMSIIVESIPLDSIRDSFTFLITVVRLPICVGGV